MLECLSRQKSFSPLQKHFIRKTPIICSMMTHEKFTEQHSDSGIVAALFSLAFACLYQLSSEDCYTLLALRQF